MEYVDGKDLEWWIRQRGPFSVRWACDFCRQAALGLQHAHQMGLVHRDMKPSNLLVVRESHEKTPQVKILDFGLARLTGKAHKTLEGVDEVVVGTIGFMAPEQIRHPETPDIRNDIFSLGSTLFYLLSGRLAFEGKTEQEVLASVFHRGPRSVRTYAPDAPAALDTLLGRMLQRDPDQRFQTPGEVAEALLPFTESTSKSAAGAGQTAPIPPSVALQALQDEPALQATVDIALKDFSDGLTDHPVEQSSLNIDSLMQGELEPVAMLPITTVQHGFSWHKLWRRFTASVRSNPGPALIIVLMLLGLLVAALWLLLGPSAQLHLQDPRIEDQRIEDQHFHASPAAGASSSRDGLFARGST
jgi:serine/threonine protein kinase